METQPTYDTQRIDDGEPETKCPFVSKMGPECKLCGAPPTEVNLEPDGIGFCDDCGGRFRIRR